MPTFHDAFISYSRQADGELAPVIERALETLARPFLRRRVSDVFVDRTSLSADPSLWGAIVEHLAGSRWFVLLASPASASSTWCLREIEWWLEHHGTQRLLIVITEGSVAWDRNVGDFDWSCTDALAPVFAGRFEGEPLYEDLRAVARAPMPALRNTVFRAAMVSLAASIRGVRKDELDADDLRATRRARQAAAGAAVVLLGATASAVWSAISAAAAERARVAVQFAESSMKASLPQVALREALTAHALNPEGVSALALFSALGRAPHLQRYIKLSGDAPYAAAVDSASGLLVSAVCEHDGGAGDCRRSRVRWEPIDGNPMKVPPPRTLDSGPIDDIFPGPGGRDVFVLTRNGAFAFARQGPSSELRAVLRGSPAVAIALARDADVRAVAFEREAKIFGRDRCRAFTLDRIATNGLAITVDGSRAAAADGRGTIEVLDLGRCSHTTLHTMDTHGALAFDTAGRWLFAVMLDGTRSRWEVGTAQPMQVLGAGTALQVPSGALRSSPHAVAPGARAISLADGNEIRIHRFAPHGVAPEPADLAQRWAALPPATVLAGHAAPVTRTRFSDDGRWLLSTDVGGTVALWRLDRSDALAAALREELPGEDPRFGTLAVQGWQAGAARRQDGLTATIVPGVDRNSTGDTPMGTWRIALGGERDGSRQALVLDLGESVEERTPESLQFSPAGALLVKRRSGAVSMWHLDHAHLVQRACIAVGIGPSAEEVRRALPSHVLGGLAPVPEVCKVPPAG